VFACWFRTRASSPLSAARSPDGEARYAGVRAHLAGVTRALFDFPADDLAVAGRVLATVTARASAVLAAPQ
jgi:hypothetical protein